MALWIGKRYSSNSLCKLLTLNLSPPDEDTKNPLGDYTLPFEPRQHKDLIPKEFSDATTHLDLNNIPDDMPNANVIQQNQGNALNLDQNALGLFLNSLMPWNEMPQQPQ